MIDEAQQDLTSVTKPREPAIDEATDLSCRPRRGIAKVLFDMPVAQFLRVEVGRVGRQFLDEDVSASFDVLLHTGRTMRLQAVPDDDDRARHVTLELLECRHNVRASHAVIEVAAEDPPRQRQRDDGRHRAPAARAPKSRRLSLRRPGRGRAGQEPEARFVDEEDFGPDSASLFLIRGQSRVSHASTSSSSRSLGRGMGTCGVQPKLRSFTER